MKLCEDAVQMESQIRNDLNAAFKWHGRTGITAEGMDTLLSYCPVLQKDQGTHFPLLCPECLQSSQSSPAGGVGIPAYPVLYWEKRLGEAAQAKGSLVHLWY